MRWASACSFAEGEGPRFERPIRDEADVAQLAVPDMDRLRYVFDAVAEIRRALDGRVPLIGFAGSPWTLACYMVEGAGSSEYRLIKTMLYSRPDLLHRILAINADAVAAYLNAQIRRGRPGGDGVRQLGRRAVAQRVRPLQPRLHATRPQAADPRTRRSTRPGDRVHEGRRALARGHRSLRARRDRPRLDDRHRRRTPPRRTPRSACRATSIRASCSARPKPCATRRWRASIAWPKPVRSMATSSTWATASTSTRRSTTSRVLVDAVHDRSKALRRPARVNSFTDCHRRFFSVSERSGLDLSPKSKSDCSYEIDVATQHH